MINFIKMQIVLYDLYNHFNKTKFNNELPEAIITIQNNNKLETKGWVSKTPFWVKVDNSDTPYKALESYYEINICAEVMSCHIYMISNILLHQMVHLYCTINNIEDFNEISSHTEHFKEQAEKIGLSVHLPYSTTWLTKELEDEIDKLNIDKDIFTLCRIDDIKNSKFIKF